MEANVAVIIEDHLAVAFIALVEEFRRVQGGRAQRMISKDGSELANWLAPA